MKVSSLIVMIKVCCHLQEMGKHHLTDPTSTLQIVVVLTVMGYAFGCLEPPCCRMVCSCQRANITAPVDCTCSAEECSSSFIDNCQNSCKLAGPSVSSDEEFRCGCFCKMHSVSEQLVCSSVCFRNLGMQVCVIFTCGEVRARRSTCPFCPSFLTKGSKAFRGQTKTGIEVIDATEFI